jgi:hypothetical protein
MADTKISALPGSTTPLAGTEVLPIVQSGATVKATVENVLTSAQPSGVVNGVTYLNGSKISTSSSSLLFNGTALSIGTSNTPGLLNTFGTATGTSQVGLTIANGGLTAGSTVRFNFLTGEDGTVGRTRAIIEATTPVANDGGLVFYTRVAGAQTVRFTLGSSDVTANTGNFVVSTSGKGVTLPGGITWTSGSGSPEGAVTAPVGSLYSRSDGGLLSSLYVKESGAGNTGWVGK